MFKAGWTLLFLTVAPLASPTDRPSEPATVVVYHQNAPGWGNGCPVSAQMVVTAAHVVGGDESMLRYSSNTSSGTLVVRRRDKDDVAVLQTDGAALPFGRVAKALPNSGDPIFVLSRDEANPRLVVHGWYFAKNGSRILLDALVVGGMSGSCVLNEAGEVFAVVVGRGDPGQPGESVVARSLLVASSLVGRKL